MPPLKQHGFQPWTSTRWPDGIAGAPRGRPQYPRLLDRYCGNRPPWNVAAVDYRVGIDEGTVLQDWRTLPIGGAQSPNSSLDPVGGLVRIFDPMVLNGVDFSLGVGARFDIETSSQVTFVNCLFAGPLHGSNVNNLIQIGIPASVLITKCKFDGVNLGGMNQFVTSEQGGTIIITYCWMANSQAQEYAANNAGGPTIYVFKYNMIDDTSNHGSGAHANWMQLTGTVTYDVEFNTGIQYSLGGAEGYQTDAEVSMPHPILANNIVISLPNYSGNLAPFGNPPVTFSNTTSVFSGVNLQNGASLRFDGSTTLPTGGNFAFGTVFFVVNASGTTFQLAANFNGPPLTGTSTGTGLQIISATANPGPQTMSNMIEGNHGVNDITGVGTNANNYFDLTGVLVGAYYSGTMTPAEGWTSTNNRNLVDGSLIVPQ